MEPGELAGGIQQQPAGEAIGEGHVHGDVVGEPEPGQGVLRDEAQCAGRAASIRGDHDGRVESPVLTTNALRRSLVAEYRRRTNGSRSTALSMADSALVAR